jgi:hypothetical protein
MFFPMDGKVLWSAFGPHWKFWKLGFFPRLFLLLVVVYFCGPYFVGLWLQLAWLRVWGLFARKPRVQSVNLKPALPVRPNHLPRTISGQPVATTKPTQPEGQL